MADLMNSIKSRYLKLLGNEPPFFTDCDYTIEQFAADLGTNRSYASKFTNRELGLSFSALLNRLRLAHFLRLRNENPQTSLGNLAKKCGFSNAFSFRRVFRKEYGTSPSEYFKKHTK
ncbi:MAG: helix-turn-helix transcriptional regulator [Bacteroidaceae bacterium]|nr:helix-turn-helix transcriptional regulator [Bacteroidaceae bacterium]